MLSQKARYAIKALHELSVLAPGETLRTSELAERAQAPHQFLEAIFLELRRAELVVSRRGRSGGYALAKPASDISYAEIIRLVDGPIALAACASQTYYEPCADCPNPGDCRLRHVLMAARDAAAHVLESLRLDTPMPEFKALALTP